MTLQSKPSKTSAKPKFKAIAIVFGSLFLFGLLNWFAFSLPKVRTFFGLNNNVSQPTPEPVVPDPIPPTVVTPTPQTPPTIAQPPVNEPVANMPIQALHNTFQTRMVLDQALFLDHFEAYFGAITDFTDPNASQELNHQFEKLLIEQYQITNLLTSWNANITNAANYLTNYAQYEHVAFTYQTNSAVFVNSVFAVTIQPQPNFAWSMAFLTANNLTDEMTSIPVLFQIVWH